MSVKEFQFAYSAKSSRLYGKTIAVEICPAYICPFSCIHCRHGKMKRGTTEPASFFSPNDLSSTLAEFAKDVAPIDSIVLYANGEPLLNATIQSLIEILHHSFHRPIAIDSCGTLLWKDDVRDGIANADMVVASLDAPDSTIFQCVNRPQCGTSFDLFVEGLRRFSKTFKGKLFLRVTLLDGITAIEAEVKKLASIAGDINPSKVILQTACSTSPEKFAFPVDIERLRSFSRFFKGKTIVMEHDSACRPA